MSEFGINHFWVQLDWVGRTLAVLLLGMSLVTWALLLGWVLEGLIGFMRRNRAPAAAVPTDIELAPPSGGHHEAALLGEVQAALRRRAEGASFADAGGLAAPLTRVLRQRLDAVSVAQEWGLTMLASIASIAPYVGLLGTVWGIYHALIRISATGQAGLDAVAGPVGEALIMTALGLAVAIPAVFGHNLRQRRNRLLLARLDDYAVNVLRQATLPSAQGTASASANAPAPAEVRVPIPLHGRG